MTQNYDATVVGVAGYIASGYVSAGHIARETIAVWSVQLAKLIVAETKRLEQAENDAKKVGVTTEAEVREAKAWVRKYLLGE